MPLAVDRVVLDCPHAGGDGADDQPSEFGKCESSHDRMVTMKV